MEARASIWVRTGVGLASGLCCGFVAKELGLRSVVSYWGSQGPMIVGAALLGALLWQTRLRVLAIATTALFVLAWAVVSFSPLTMTLARPLTRNDTPRNADAIFVLSSNVQPDDEPTPTALSRATRGLELLGQGLAPRLYFSELGPPAGSYTAYVRQSASRMGVPHSDAISAVGLVGDTHDEAVKLAALFQREGWHRLLLVTSPTHSRRAAATFEHAGVPEVISVPAVETLVDIERLRFSDDRAASFGMIVHEWVGLWVYRLRGWI